ncbi:MAG TPA: TraR/DksA family transcriptional regulator [Thermoanaerobaculia bacterium]|nr:TraR/DksA family transcriptional regulator [Thermoanaerobaculia bacterium]
MGSNGNGRTTEDILDPEQIEVLRKRLLEEKQRILDLYEQDLKAGQETGDFGTEDLVDQANAAWNRELNFALSDGERKQLLLIDAAIRRLDDGTYGFCLHSGEPIAFPRLQAVPWARYTVDVQERIEKGLLEPEDEA